MFKYLSAFSTAIASAAVFTLLVGLAGFGFTGSLEAFNPNTWMLWLQVFAGFASAIAGFISFFCVLDVYEDLERKSDALNHQRGKAEYYKEYLDNAGIRPVPYCYGL